MKAVKTDKMAAHNKAKAKVRTRWDEVIVDLMMVIPKPILTIVIMPPGPANYLKNYAAAPPNKTAKKKNANI